MTSTCIRNAQKEFINSEPTFNAMIKYEFSLERCNRQDERTKPIDTGCLEVYRMGFIIVNHTRLTDSETKEKSKKLFNDYIQCVKNKETQKKYGSGHYYHSNSTYF